MQKFEMNLVGGLGVAVFLIGILLLWAGLNLPGTTGHSGTFMETLLVVSGGTLAMGTGALIINTATNEGVTWKFWLSTFTVFFSLFGFCYATYLRASELGVF